MIAINSWWKELFIPSISIVYVLCFGICKHKLGLLNLILHLSYLCLLGKCFYNSRNKYKMHFFIEL